MTERRDRFELLACGLALLLYTTALLRVGWVLTVVTVSPAVCEDQLAALVKAMWTVFAAIALVAVTIIVLIVHPRPQDG